MGRIYPVSNVVKLTPAIADPIPGHCAHPLPLSGIMEGEEEWIVEEILDSKIMNRKLCYLVKWESFGIKHNSWEPWDNVHAPEQVAEFYWRNPGAAWHIWNVDFNEISFCPINFQLSSS